MEVTFIASRKIHKLLQHLNLMQSMKIYVILGCTWHEMETFAIIKGKQLLQRRGKSV